MPQPEFRTEEVDFEASYQGKPPVEGMEFALEVPPWDIGEAQPEIARLIESGELQDEVLDVGCGLGDNAILLAQHGHCVTAVDRAPTALATARERAQQHGVDIEFVHADVTALDGIEQRYRTVLDSALYHCLDDQQRHDYAAALHRVTLPDAHLHVYCLTDADQGAPPRRSA
ncbi:class I SAM-dependent methyltransferase [Amycolatopsis jiangsuensis]|uniref:2-polyprenyl-3-methyl-5-hydroxy-6-metoxy-1, 4-benzoquinol methylase n=1 Tax=Amycolatopsis jiangsuensis TaxID=1181879 RepID=A0A840IP31_9PSEU|nr:class I SAM-dependent methyltransferase [Amycolatopsis jiangsuensis]MBB4683319.1 2-polyprenyl-3-methyl-5-hydroxy-6-metoxy-1,4-benzoquinol methylase [Amycolatopsis jiangsuensis]